jgi:hypothetical protein
MFSFVQYRATLSLKSYLKYIFVLKYYTKNGNIVGGMAGLTLKSLGFKHKILIMHTFGNVTVLK